MEYNSLNLPRNDPFTAVWIQFICFAVQRLPGQQRDLHYGWWFRERGGAGGVVEWKGMRMGEGG